MKRLQECLNDSFEKCYLLPFFWQHGESHERLVEELDRIQVCGIHEFCVESRIHPAFCEDAWWEDFGFLLSEAERRGMKVWLLDDKQFPSGYANGYLVNRPELWKRSLTVEYRDFVSVGKPIALIPPEKIVENISDCLAIRAYRRNEAMQAAVAEDSVDLLPSYRGGLLYVTLPMGVWRVYYIRMTRESLAGWEHYVDMLSLESCHAMIDAIYEPHYRHFSQYFGTVFRGFFSDEPCFSNAFASYESKLGTEDMLIPWSRELHERIAKAANIDMDAVLSLLPALWHDVGQKTKLMRHHYMNEATQLYQRNFVNQLGDWCRDHRVEYIGHVIEDMNTHQRLGYGCGHYFRATSGQDMAGIDVVLHQLVPGFTDHEHTLPVCGKKGSPEFFEYLLGKLCISQAQLNPLTKGRAMCEIFGAYGWAEGVPLMKKLADSMLVNGINRYVPHAFDSQYPNPDCPPHFSMGGDNPQFSQFSTLCQYMQRASHLLDGGFHDAEVAVFYNAVGEWNGGKNMLTQRVAKYLTRAHVDFEIVWEDVLASASVENGRIRIGQKAFRLLLIPYAESYPSSLLTLWERLALAGAEICFVGGYPATTVEGQAFDQSCSRLGVISEDAVEEAMKAGDYAGFACSEELPLLRFYHYKHEDGEIYVFKNDDIFRPVQTHITLKTPLSWRWYACWENKLYLPETDGESLTLSIGEGGIAFLVESCHPAEARLCADSQHPILLSASSIIAKDKDGKEFSLEGTEKVDDEHLSDFCGRIRYQFEFTTEKMTRTLLTLENIGESADIFLNGRFLGSLVETPYQLEITEAMTLGENTLHIDVYVNAGFRHRDFFSTYLPLPLSGLSGAVTLWQQEDD